MFEKISKDDWLKLGKEEQDLLTLKFRESQEQTHKLYLIITRVLAFICILGLFYIGYSQLKVVTSDTNIRSQYGSLGYCYLCGLETLRSCTCQYNEHSGYDYSDVNLTKLAEETAQKNIEGCPIKNSQGYVAIDYNLSKMFGNKS